ncbi:MAG: DUF5103 domain-containing protein [Bacteroidales bacterium]|nr:DUF5103 domain-containing protein [Bacteroidales bacterium]
MKKIFASIVLIILFSTAFSQQYDNISFENKTYVDGVVSVKLTPANAPLGFPIIDLGSGEQLRLVFDDINGNDNRYLKYTVIHCTYDWKPSDLNPFDYIDGFFEDEISTHSYSFSTIQNYVNFELLFPNDMLNITKSGNYLLFVYDETPDNPILTRRFMVKESESAIISGVVHSASDVRYRNTAQEVDFVVNTGDYVIHNPARSLTATILQNGRWDNAIIGLRYRFGKPGEYNFDYDENENSFFGSSEFRTFSLKSTRYNGDRVASLTYKSDGYHALVLEDIARPYGAYQGSTTLKGKCYWETSDYDDRNREEYIDTRFSLKCDFPITDGDIYVFGELTDWQIKDEAKLRYNEYTHYWESNLYLKQGYYNYQYVFVHNGSTEIDATYIEGSHWETDNDYSVFVYLNDETSLYDRLIGVEFFHTIYGR